MNTKKLVNNLIAVGSVAGVSLALSSFLAILSGNLSQFNVFVVAFAIGAIISAMGAYRWLMEALESSDKIIDSL